MKVRKQLRFRSYWQQALNKKIKPQDARVCTAGWSCPRASCTPGESPSPVPSATWAGPSRCPGRTRPCPPRWSTAPPPLRRNCPWPAARSRRRGRRRARRGRTSSCSRCTGSGTCGFRVGGFFNMFRLLVCDFLIRNFDKYTKKKK